MSTTSVTTSPSPVLDHQQEVRVIMALLKNGIFCRFTDSAGEQAFVYVSSAAPIYLQEPGIEPREGYTFFQFRRTTVPHPVPPTIDTQAISHRVLALAIQKAREKHMSIEPVTHWASENDYTAVEQALTFA